MKKNHIDIITLGCSKNLVDSERLAKQFDVLGYKVRYDAENPQTCKNIEVWGISFILVVISL